MKSPIKIALPLVMCLVAMANAMDEKGYASIYESIAAFEDRPQDKPNYDARIFNRPGYVKPIVANLGNVLNSNWYVSSSIPQSMVFEAGMPLSLISIGGDDQSFTENGASVPTIFGGHGDPKANPSDKVVYGNETLHNLGLFTYPYLQVAGSYYHARIALRGMWLPAVSELQKFNLLGIGLQYSFGHLFQYMLPKQAQGLDVSLVLGYSSSGISYQPEDYEGTLDLDISAFTFDVVIGYKLIAPVEFLLTLGYQSAEMASSGHLISHAEGWTKDKDINPNLTVDGNNGFKFGLAVAFQVGSSFHPVVGYDYAGKSSFTTNILYFKQQFGEDKTPDEIAKEKGYVRGGNVSNEDDEAEETPKAKKKKALKKKKVVEQEPEEEDEDNSEFDDF